MRVFVTGGTGLVGSRLVARLRERGDQPVVLSRQRQRAEAKLGAGVEIVEGDPTARGAWERAIDGCAAVVHLAGENVFASRWNDEVKRTIRSSRVDSTSNVAAAIGSAAPRPNVLVSASAIGYYGFHGDEELTESDAPGDDFLARASVDWEAAAHGVEASGTRLVIVRVGVVLATEGGALAKMLTPFRLGVGGRIGSGRQWISWVHRDDLVGIILHAIDRGDVRGVLNGTAPEPVTNQDFARALGRALGRPSFLPTPVFALRLGLGEVAEIIARGQRVVPRRTREAGYVYRFPSIAAALEDLLRRK